ncbi:proprotein convertase P-domain-containing protein [Emcibacter sp.]|uniref:proprotein convertase P-domain-containing protein n=1 Tax=Emcibacter sp. TaxID=1979954 RepID=UPI002AA794A8|nr:proprotein convertase P-domain-containing protein [Emcibacter sp.]
MKKSIKNTAAVVALMAGFALPSAAMATIYTNDTDFSIADNSVIQSDINVAETGTLSSITVEAGIDHTWIGDLRITLVAADGTEITLMDRPGLADDTCCGTSADLASGNPLIFDDASVVAAEDAAGGGTFAPDEALATLLGSSITGTWSLLVNDRQGGDQGRLDYWSLNINWEQVQVSEPASLALLGFGLAGVGLARRRKV